MKISKLNKFNRRYFLQFTGSLMLATTREKVLAEAWLQIQVWTVTGEPLDRQKLSQLYFLNLEDQPLPTPVYRVETGSFWFKPPSALPWAIALFLSIPDFGEVTVYADNQGKGYTAADFPLNLNLALALSRLHRVEEAMDKWRNQGIEFPERITDKLKRAKTYLDYAANEGMVLQSKWLYASLAASMWAGEEAAIYQSQQVIEKKRDFLWGANFFGYPELGEKYTYYFQNLFNFATIPTYWSFLESNLETVDKMVNWLYQAGITIKGHPLVWFHEASIPSSFENKSYSTIKQSLEIRILATTTRYGHKIHYYDIINEANGVEWANKLGYSQSQFLELTEMAALSSRKGNPNVYRIINHCCLWAENVAYYPPPQYSPYQYLKACIGAEIPFEAIGLQLYYPNRDMFEINRLLERFASLGKPIHITEIGVASDSTPDENAYIRESKGFWHQPWSESIQADWLEQLYTICYSKPYIKAISWWDLADVNQFWPHGALLNSKIEPKLAYFRLSRQLRSWGF